MTTRLPDGRDIRLCYYQDIAILGSNKGWRVDDIDIYVDNHPAGYQKMAYIPQDSFDRYYPNALAFNCRVQGHNIELEPYLDKPVAQLPLRELRMMVHDLEQSVHWGIERPGPEVERDELLARYNASVGQITKSCRGQYLDFKSYWLDRPMVDFIRVYEENDYDVQIAGTCVDVKPTNHRGQGLGRILYLAGAIAMHDQGMELRASTLQSEPAAAVRGHLEAEGLVDNVKSRHKTFRVLNGGVILEKHPHFRLPLPGVPEYDLSTAFEVDGL
jgi:hypothetical protein